jgi:aspartyl-tRNA(Asn)/glutamyl-tRNA(Gln) amidotransferase subunit A
VLGRHYAEPLLLDLALLVERERPWPLTAPPLVSSSTSERT